MSYTITRHDYVAQIRVRKQDGMLDEFAYIVDDNKVWQPDIYTSKDEKWKKTFRNIAIELVGNGEVDEDDMLFIVLTEWEDDCVEIITANVSKTWDGNLKVVLDKAYMPE